MMIGCVAPYHVRPIPPRPDGHTRHRGVTGDGGRRFPDGEKGRRRACAGRRLHRLDDRRRVGAIVLTGAIFAARPIILAMGFGEQLLLVILALSMIGMLTGTSALKGLATCCFGLLLGSMGSAPATGEFRLAFESIYLSDGIPIVIVGLGMFAMPEIIELLRRSTRIAESRHARRTAGSRASRMCSAIGGSCSAAASSAVSSAPCRASAAPWSTGSPTVTSIQTSKNRERFGTGDVRGVIGARIRQQRQGRRRAHSHAAVWHSGIGQHGDPARRLHPDRHRTGRHHADAASRSDLHDDLVVGDGQRPGDGALPRASPITWRC